jgi:hypothetical protein
MGFSYHKAISTEVSSQKSDEFSGSKGGKRKFHDIWKSSICGSFMIPVTTLIM